MSGEPEMMDHLENQWELQSGFESENSTENPYLPGSVPPGYEWLQVEIQLHLLRCNLSLATQLQPILPSDVRAVFYSPGWKITLK